MPLKIWPLKAFLLISLFLPAVAVAETNQATATAIPTAKRIVSIGGEISETLFALGVGGSVVAVDTTSTWPQAVTTLPNVGYARQLAAEGLLSMNPDLVIANHDAGPPQVLARIRDAGVPLHQVTTGPGLEQAAKGIRAVAAAINRVELGKKLVAEIRADLKRLNAQLPQDDESKHRVLFVIGGRGGQLLVAGSNTRANTVIGLAGAHNAALHQGYKPVSKEGLIQLNPDVVLVAAHALPAAGGLSDFIHSSGLQHSNAGQNGRIHSVDAARTLTMGAGLGQAVVKLARLFYPNLDKEHG